MAFPSEDQAAVINHEGRPLIVVAAPGTGKTRTIVTRMVRLLAENPNREVCFVTFTRTSRRDTESKVRDAVGRVALEEAAFEFPRISTLHTLAKSLVHKHAALIGRDPGFSVMIDEHGERDVVFAELLEDLELDIPPEDLKRDIFFLRSVGDWPSRCSVPLGSREAVTTHFDRLLRLYNTFDIEGLVPAASEILANNAAQLPRIFLHVDEYQDLNPWDQRLVTLLVGKSAKDAVIVGDDAQSIYGFRHAEPVGITELWNSTAWAKIAFSECHRLPAHILRAAHGLISGRGYLGAGVTIPPDDGRRLLTLQCTKSNVQVRAVARLIQEWMRTKRKLAGDALFFRDFMVLCPTLTFVKNVARSLQEDYGIPTRLRDRISIPEDHWRLLLLLRLLELRDSLALRQWLSRVGLPPPEITALRREALGVGGSFYDYCLRGGNATIQELFADLERLRASRDNADEFRRRLGNFPNLVVEDTLFPQVGITIDEATGELPSTSSVIRSVYEKFGLLETEEDISDDDKVLVTTMHSAKGLEAEFVFIMWINDTFMPAHGRDPDEERRVLYVALTRGRQDAVLAFHERFEGGRLLKVQAMSPFLQEIGPYLAIKRIKASDVQ